MKLLKIDETGLFIEDVIVDEIPMVTHEDEEGNLTLVPNPLYVETPCEGGFVHPKWNGTQWVEGASQEVLDAIETQKMEQLFMPSQEEIDKATREIETINLLVDLGVIV